MWPIGFGFFNLMSAHVLSAKKSTDVVIIGGGIIGLLSARELVHAGATVTLIDKNKMGKESSWAGGGILSPLYPWRYPASVNVLASWSTQRYAALATTLQTETGIDPQWTQSGLLILDTLSLEEQNTAREWAMTANSRFKLLANKDLHSYFDSDSKGLESKNSDSNGNVTALSKKFTKGIELPDVAQIRNPRLVRALKTSLLTAGVNFVENSEVTDIVIENNRISHVTTLTDKYSAEKIVVASGAWSTPLLAKVGIRIEVKPVRGQMILIKAEPGLISNIILYNNRYLIPRRDGRILVGSTLEEVGFDKSLTEAAKQSLWQTAGELIPAITQFSIEHHWAGLRPGSLMGVPTISAHPVINNLYINTGHFRNGVILGPASARLLTNIMTKKHTILDPKPYALGQT